MNSPMITPNFCKYETDWDGETVYIVAGGPSLHGFNFDILKGKIVVAVKSAAEHLPWATAYMSMDAVAWKTPSRLKALKDARFSGEIWMAVPKTYNLANVPCDTSHVKFIIRDNLYNEGLSTDPSCVYGFNSAVAAINMAYLRGAARIILMGFDLAKGGYWYNMTDTNWVNDRQVNGKIQTREQYIEEQVEYMATVEFDLIASGVWFEIFKPANPELSFIKTAGIDDL